MANKKFKVDEYGFPDMDLDMPSSDFDFGNDTKVKDDRSPTMKVGKAVLRGARDTAKSPSFIRKLVLNALPKGYGQAFELADKSASSINGLYNESVTEMKPLIKDLKRSTSKILPSVESKLPKKLADKIKSWSKTDDLSGDQRNLSSLEGQRDAMLAMQMGDIFKHQIEDNLRRDNETRAKDAIRDGIEHARHRDVFSQLDAVRIGIQQIAAYKNKVESGFQRKSLELQFRQYFVAQDTVTELKKVNASLSTNLEGILKNTGLPDFVKLTKSESLKQMMRNKFLESIDNNIFAKRDAFIQSLGNRLSKKFKESISGFKDAFSSAKDMGETVSSMGEMAGDMGISSSEMYGEMIGGMAADSISGKAGKWLGNKARKHVPKKYMDKVDRFGNKLEYISGNAAQIATDWANNDTGRPSDVTPQPGIRGKIQNVINSSPIQAAIDFLKGTIRETNGIETGLILDNAASMETPSIYTRGASKSITEIIPGYLSRIYRELQIMRTGDSKIELTTYDYSTNKFAEKSKVARNIVSDILGQSARDNIDKEKEIKELKKKKKLTDREKSRLQYLESSLRGGSQHTQNNINDLLAMIDPNGVLNDQQKTALGKYMLQSNLRGSSGSFSRMANAKTYKGHNEADAAVYASLFASILNSDKDNSKQLKFAQLFSQLGYGDKDGRKEIQDYVNTGNIETLEELGLYNPASGSINIEKLRELYLTGHPDLNQTLDSSEPARRMHVNRGRGRQRRQDQPQQRTIDVSNIGPSVSTESNIDISPLVKTTESVLQELKSNNVKTITETISETLLRIEQRVNSGILSYSVTGETPEQTKRWYQATIGDVIGLAGKGIKAGYNTAKFAAGKLFDAGKLSLLSAFKVGNMLTGRAFEHISNRIRKIRDVYVQGEMFPRLLAAKMKAGEYYDQATKKVIKSYKDISSAVVDKDGNIVLTAEEVKNAFVKTTLGQKLITALGATIKKANEIGKTVLFNIPPLLRLGANALKWTYNRILKHAEDVYVRGKPDPVLLAITMRAGGYASRVSSKEIRYPGDIDGPVVDEKGNIVLTAEDIAAGLLNKNGQPLRIGIGKVTGLIGDVYRYGKKKATQAFNFAKDKAMGALSTSKNFILHGINGLRSEGIPIEREKGRPLSKDGLIIKRLTEIRDVLQSRLPRSRKIRKGSYEDRMAEGKDKLKDLLAAGKDKATGFGNSIFSMASAGMAGLAKMFGFGKKKSSDDDEDDDSGIMDTAESYLMDKVFDRFGKWGRKGWKGIKKLGSKLGGKLGLGGRAAAAGAGVAGTGAATAAAGQVGARGYQVGRSLASGVKAGGKLAGPLAALLSAGEGMWDLGNIFTGRTNVDSWNQNNGKFDWLKMLSPWEMGKYVGNKINNNLINPAVAKLTGDPNETLGGALFGAVDKLTRAIKGEKDPNAPITIDEINKERAKQGKPPLPAKPSATPGSNAAVKQVAAQINSSASGTTGIDKPVTSAGVPPGLNKFSEGQVSALDALRFKAYGLKEMEIDKVKALVSLEARASQYLSYDSDYAASWDGDIMQIAKEGSGIFGIKEVDDPDGNSWTSWFNKRFLPVYLAYASGVAMAKKEGKKRQPVDISNLKQKDLVEVANRIISTKVWSFPKGPWPNYEINDNPSSTDKNLQSIKDGVKDNILNEKKSTVDIGVDKQTAVKSAKAAADAASGNQNQPSWMDSTKSFFSQAWDATKNAGMKVYDAVANTARAAYDVGVSGLKKGVEYASNVGSAIASGYNALTGGSTIQHPGNGTGGDINSLPMPKGDGSYAALKDLIAGAAKMVGVDEKLMATMAAIESGFRSTVKAGTSSATGLYQFITDTWNTMIRKYGPKYGISPGTRPTDPRANALMGAEFIKENANALKGVKANLTDTDLYAAHFLGAGGAKKLLGANPNEIAANILPAAARANASIFYKDGNLRGNPKTVAEVYQHLNSLVRNKGKQFGLDSGSASIPTPPPATGNETISGTGITSPANDPNKLGSTSAPLGGTGNTPPTEPAAPTVPANAVAGAVASPTPPSSIMAPGASAISAGFNPASANDVIAQKQYQKDISEQSLGKIGDTLQSSLAVQQSQLEVLQKILNIVSTRKPDAGQESGSSDNLPNKKSPLIRSGASGLSDMTKAPVSMKKSMV